VRRLFAFIAVLAVSVAGAAVWWVDQPLSLHADTVDLAIAPGTSARGVAQAAVDSGVQGPSILLYAWFRLSGEGQKIKAGSYEIERGATPRSLLSKLVRGDQALRTVTVVEGWTFNQMRDALLKAEHLRQETRGLAPDSIMKLLGKPGQPPEGQFFPDTYTYAKGSSDVAIYQRALRAMEQRLAAAWAQRASDSPLKTPQQALTLASIVEKETGRSSDRAMIAGVFSNRLRIGMRLQTDPTVIYGLGAAFDGNLRRRDLQTDTPWNTYTRMGLPPTPIALPGQSALLAAVQPASTQALYFVARGDGSSHFSASLDEHNRAVNKYQRGQ
jgi:UPF0755 protein